MGIEYRISGASFSGIEEFLRDLGGQDVAGFPGQFEFRFGEERETGIPDATVILDAEEIWFCDNGGEKGAVATLFRRVIDEVLARSGDEIVIREG